MPPRRPRHAKERPPDPRAVEAPWRLFVAVPLPPPVIESVRGLVRDLSAEGWPVRWVAAETAHLTLQFLGDTPPERAELLRLALPPLVAGHPAFDLRTADLGVFPNQKRPRVLWLGLWGPAHRLETLQRAVTGLLRDLEFPVDDRPFHPHITLGRLRDAPNTPTRDLPAAIQRRYAELAAAGRGTAKAPTPVPVREVLLMRSFLGRDGARHEPLARCPLGPPAERPRPRPAVTTPEGAVAPPGERAEDAG
ncbi:MAG: 2'-5' RNA ligase [uncultured Thermomicrobiales bacterium]|uniref:RNA 2',3'-cyclic phosphodiesterase n=1 Tax=uncultured Thermomicrobiales bacterium TaxID=1645740 RepID=A0A6J4VK91_9BACT|nr:MAG: 2'-5' RNA ligase [uncultured Thermomicrobiales bacterium]